MDTNNKIIGIVFEIDLEKYRENKGKAMNENRASMLAAKSIMVFHQDSKNEYIDLSNYSDNAKETQIKNWIDKARQAGVSRNEVKSYFSPDPIVQDCIRRAKNEEEYLDAKTREDVAKDVAAKTTRKHGVRTTAAVVALAITTTLAGCSCNTKREEATAIESNEEYEDWMQYFSMQPDSMQKEFFVESFNWLINTNASEAWEKLTLTDEKMEEYGYTIPECIYGFTAEEAYALALRFNAYTKDQYVQITGGQEMDVTSLMDAPDSISNNALSKIQAYYFLSDICDLHIEKVITFTDEGQAKINELETLFREYKVLDNDEGKEKEAQEKMEKIKSVIVNCAYNATFDNEAKSYILRTFAPTANRISQMHNYKTTIEVSAYDEKADKEVTLKVKTDLFDEITNRALWLGFNETEGMGAFDSESFLTNHNINASRYNLLNVDVARSIADQSCGVQMSRLEEANEYIAALRLENLTAETAAASNSITNLFNRNKKIDPSTLDRVDTTYDKLIEETKDADYIVELLNDYAKEQGIYPENAEYFTTIMMSLKMQQYNSTHGVTQGKPGDIIKTTTKTQTPVTESQLSAPNSTVLNHAGEQVTAESAMEEARKENEEQTGIMDASTPEASEKADQDAQQSVTEYAALLQNIYNCTYNTYYGKNVLSTTLAYNANWANSSDANIRDRHNTAKVQAESRKAQEEQAAKDNEQQQNQTPDIDSEFKDAEISDQPKAPVESVDNTKPEQGNNENIPPVDNSVENSQPEIDYDEGFEDAVIEGDIIIGEPVNNLTSEPSILTVESFDELESIIQNMTDEEWEAFIGGATPVPEVPTEYETEAANGMSR